MGERTRTSAILTSACAIAVVLSVLACGPPKIDAETDDSLTKSVERVKKSLSREQLAEFDRAVVALAFEDLHLSSLVKGESLEPDDLLRQLKDKVDGKTGAEIIARGKALAEERAAREKRQALQEIGELEAKAKAATEAAVKLAAFEVTRSRYRIIRSRYSTDARIDLSVKNGTDHAVATAHFHGVLASPGRSVPWHSADFNYPIPGGLEPGESASWHLDPSYSWPDSGIPAAAVFTVTVVRIDGADGEAIYDAEGLDEFEQARLDELKRQYLG